MLANLPPTVRLIGLGWYLAFCIAGGIIGGVLLDRWLGTEPIFVMVGLFGGLFLAFWGGYFMLMEALGKGRNTQRTTRDD
jgi:F0F1-type ATP synthase assembly protein I